MDFPSVQINNSTLHSPIFNNYEAKKEIPKALTKDPFRPELFLGREGDLQHIHDFFFSTNSSQLLLISGEGGIGKTSLASRYYHAYKREYMHVAWLLSGKSIVDALLQLAPALNIQFDKQMDTEQRIEMLLTNIASLPEPCLLILDNANELPDLDLNYQRLRNFSNFHLLITTRITAFKKAEILSISGLPQNEALALFEKNYRSLDDDERELFMQVREAIGGNTLVLELFAKNLAEQNPLQKQYSLADLLSDLQYKGLLQISLKQDVDTDYQSKSIMRREKPEDIIAAMYDLGELSSGETALLSVFAVLPAESINFEMLITLLPDTADIHDNLKSLALKGWVEFNKTSLSYKCSPVVQEVVRLKNQSLFDDCTPLLLALIGKLEYKPGRGHFVNASYDDAYVFARYSESLLLYFEIFHSHLALLCERLGKFHEITGEINKALFYLEQFNDFYKIVSEEYPDDSYIRNMLAISYEKIGDIYSSIRNFEKAYSCFTSELKLMHELCDANPNNLEFKHGLAITWEKVGTSQLYLNDSERALNAFAIYNHLATELHEANQADIAFRNSLIISYERLGQTHLKLGNFKEALMFIDANAKFMYSLCEAFPEEVSYKNSLSVSYNLLGDILTKMNDVRQAILFHNASFHISEELFAKFPKNIFFKRALATSCQRLGKSKAKVNDLEAAVSLFSKGILLLTELSETLPEDDSIKDELGVIYRNMGEAHKELGNLEEAFRSLEKNYQLMNELNNTNPTSNNKNSFAIASARLGEFLLKQKKDPKKAKYWFQLAEQQWKELVRDEPDDIHFKEFLETVRNDLSATLELQKNNLA